MTGILKPYFSTDNEAEPALMTVNELAEYLGIGKNRAYELLNTGAIKGFRIGSIWKISKVAVEQFIYEQSGLI
ncbi:helix-turn-helix domain-containing protein [Lachnospiraceae bacterium WCA-9-b2]|jgi:excisionase family DNA binding protein|uniref:Helix-turn-helix domain-containing protein n=1 Tax=Sporofaciens musculi TaxID=2681861 RepID=A0A7X3SL58_9FIRM|nr:helix-turn-helix domain-containing protein [Sporofaciens musculi]MXP78313.1 helix-turn-helix domain-containing protein [Sporofaciens musculi]